jgi:hypothetical protein
MTTSSFPRDSAAARRLNGWKEIAAHLDKGVRTVQRWEKELGLPVRRMGTGRGEVVFAITSELDAWQQSARTGDRGLEAIEEEERPEASHAPLVPWRDRVPRRIITIAALVLVMVSVGAWIALRAGAPRSARVQDGALRAYDGRGRLAWEHRFEFPLNDSETAAAARRASPSVVVRDIDGDGDPEVLLVTNCESAPSAAGLYCLDSRGRERFRHTPRHHVRFGSVPTTGPWRPLLVVVLPEATGRSSIWLVSNDNTQFPTVVEKLDPAGRLVGQFWHPGFISRIQPWTFQGRRVVLLAGANNDFNSASLAVLDPDRPTGTAPARRDHYQCRDCPPGDPLAFVVFPSTDIDRLQDAEQAIESVVEDDAGNLTVQLWRGSAFPELAGYDRAVTLYRLDGHLRPLSADHQPSFVIMHNELFRLGRLNHPYGPQDEAALWPVYRWNGQAFDELRPGSITR